MQKVGGGVRVLAGACDALSTPRPLGPLLDVATECEGLAAAVRIGEQPADVFAALRDELAAQTTVLVLEDIHWGDEATFDVVRLLARRMDVPGLVVATYRDDGLDRDHPLRVLVGDLATANAVSRLSLEPLSPSAVAQLAVGHEVDPSDLYERTGGNPFFVAQVLASGATGVPPTVRDAVLARASGLSADALGVLEAIALALPRAEPWLLEAVAGDRVALVEDCVATGLVTWDEDAVAFRHELARAAVEDAMPPTRRIAEQRRILAALRAAPGGRSTPPGSPTTPRPRATSSPCSSSLPGPRRMPAPRAPIARRRPSTRGRSGSVARRFRRGAAQSCWRGVPGPATWPTTRSRR